MLHTCDKRKEERKKGRREGGRGGGNDPRSYSVFCVSRFRINVPFGHMRSADRLAASREVRKKELKGRKEEEGEGKKRGVCR